MFSSCKDLSLELASAQNRSPLIYIGAAHYCGFSGGAKAWKKTMWQWGWNRKNLSKILWQPSPCLNCKVKIKKFEAISALKVTTATAKSKLWLDWLYFLHLLLSQKRSMPVSRSENNLPLSLSSYTQCPKYNNNKK